MLLEPDILIPLLPVNRPVILVDPVISVLLLMLTTVPVSVMLLSPICSPKSPPVPLVMRLVDIVPSLPISLMVCGPIISTELVVADPTPS